MNLLYEVNEIAAAMFYDWMDDSPAKQYATQERGVTQETITRWGLGFAPDSWDSLLLALVAEGYEHETIKQAGLIKSGKHGYYDVFRNRLMFPIRDVHGRIIGFGGRDLSGADGTPKYINSAQNSIFKKSVILFGLDVAIDNIETKGKAIVVEGYLDVIAAHQAGYTNVCAPLGTAITSHHLRTLGQVEIILAMDSDQGGKRATERTLDLLKDREQVKVATLPAGSDPASLIQKNPNHFGLALATATPIVSWLIEQQTQGVSRFDVERAYVAERLRGFATDQSYGLEVQGRNLQHLAGTTGFSEDLLLNQPNHPMLPLWDIESERCVLGSIMIDPDCLDELCHLLKPSDFFRQNHQILYQAMLQLRESNLAIDLVILADYLQLIGELAAIGGPTELSALQFAIPTALHATHYAKLVADKAFKRRLIYKSEELKRFLLDNLAAKPVELMAKASAMLAEVESTMRDERGLTHISETLSQTSEEIEKLYRGEEPDRLPANPSDFNRFIQGYARGSLVVIGARPSVGKTSLLIDQVLHQASAGVNVALFSLEMSTRQIQSRLVAAQGGINSRLIDIGPMGEGTYRTAMQAINFLKEKPIWTCDVSGLNWQEIAAKSKLLDLKLRKKGERLDVIGIDYLQIMSHERAQGLNWATLLGFTSRGLKQLAKELDCVVLLLSQLNRAIEYRQSREPTLADLRDSGAIEADADMVIFPFCPEPQDWPNTYRLSVAKNRNGPIGSRDVLYQKDKNRFLNLSRENEQEVPPPPTLSVQHEQQHLQLDEYEF